MVLFAVRTSRTRSPRRLFWFSSKAFTFGFVDSDDCCGHRSRCTEQRAGDRLDTSTRSLREIHDAQFGKNGLHYLALTERIGTNQSVDRHPRCASRRARTPAPRWAASTPFDRDVVAQSGKTCRRCPRTLVEPIHQRRVATELGYLILEG